MDLRLISIIVPIYNVQSYLPQCLDSLLGQTYRNLELILVDDGSPDGAPAICDDYAARDSRIVVIHQKNGGLSAARNSGITAATGDFLAFVDSDDWIHRDYIATLLQMCGDTGSEIAQCGFLRVWTDAEPPSPPASVHCQSGREMCLSICKSATHLEGIIACNKLYARHLFDEIRFPEGRLYEDEATTYRLFWQAKQVAVTTRPLYFYRQRAGSIVGSGFSRRSLDGVTALEDRAAFYRTNGAEKLWALTLLDLCGMAQDLSFAAIGAGDEEASILLRQKAMAAHNQAAATGQLGPVSRMELGMKRYFPRLWERTRTLYNRIRRR
ncbi:MAG: glycosyltransferase [Pseudoflavonifractor sp.]